MRLWTVHPCYLDPQGLVAAWREALLAQKVLRGATKGYRHHPQLARFRAAPEPLRAIGAFLHALADEADARGYHFDRRKLPPRSACAPRPLPETRGQLMHEWSHLLEKLRNRSPGLHVLYRDVARPRPHPLFRIVPGGVRDWEKQP